MQVIKSTDSGASRDGERNDCTVRALANATGVAYDAAHALAKHFGRPDRKGLFTHLAHDLYIAAGFKCLGTYGRSRRTAAIARHRAVTNHSGMTLEKAMLMMQKGRFVVMVTGHALAVVDGKIIDKGHNAAGTRVTSIYKWQD